uniref:ATP synthase subunit 8 n=1 Tax=Adelges tsugae TaxID=357502 RepID=A0A6M3WBT3_ADETS|nr:ATP synthase subunit 8 [Adelges tsugae]
MPQMAPMNWMFLYIYFLISMMIISMMIYFMFLKILKNKKYSKKLKFHYYNKFI